ncbi:equilibrative nucleoside transporter 4 [Cimex lectularius]|uniref:Equilibrative nucleoside transporter n=1 Tax=Cimex lectularius TaxID=79782 RepID=A0A8I6RNB8_CIMLE|nr:equilibrative nucleoside transporter 4 [Cimex lectularius]
MLSMKDEDERMDENLSRGYIQLGKRGGNDLRFNNGFNHLSPPVDKYDFIYLSLVLAGVGFLLPYNSFIIAVDYFQMQYPGTTIVFDMSLVYIGMAFFAVLANNLLVEALSLNTRITFGYIVSFFTLMFVAIFEICLGNIAQSKSYTANLIAVAVVSVGCTVQQSSFYGYTSMLPSRYTQAVMAGESAAGLMVSMNRMITKMIFENQRSNTLMFFLMSMFIVGLCYAIHHVIRQTDFVQFYLTLCKEAKKITLEPTEDAGLMDLGDPAEGKGSQYGVLKLQTQSPLDTSTQGHFSFANPVYEPTAPQGTTTYKVEDVVVSMSGDTAATYRRPSSRISWSSIRRAGKMRVEVIRNIWPSMTAIFVTYLVTLSLYPGIESEIISCKFASWMPVILMAVFNASDLIGKMSASLLYDVSRFRLVVLSVLRVVLIPALLLCAWPRIKPFFLAEGYSIFFSIILGLSNGILGSVPMIQAPSRVSEQHRELAGNIMTLSYNFGLTSGSIIAYAFEAMLGPPLFNPCGAEQNLSHLGYNESVYPRLNNSRFNYSLLDVSTPDLLGTQTPMTFTTYPTTGYSLLNLAVSSSPTNLTLA